MTIKLQNIGPIANLEIPVPEDGGVVVLRGRNGAGKTEALRAVDAAVSGRGRPTPRDGSQKGKVEVAGITLTVARSARRKGHLEVNTLDGKLDLSDIVEPGIKSPEAADAKRIKALVQVSGIKTDPDVFNSLVTDDEGIRAFVGPAALEPADLLTMAGRVKRDLEASARRYEDLSCTNQAQFEAARAAVADVDVRIADQGDAIQGQLEEAIRQSETLASHVASAQRDAKETEEAKRSADKIREQIDKGGLGDPAQLEQIAMDAQGTLEDATATVERLTHELAAAKAERAEAKVLRDHAVLRAKDALHTRKMLDELLEIANRPGTPMPSQEEIDAANARVTDLKQRLMDVGVAVKAREQLNTSAAAREAAEQNAAIAKRLREAASSVDNVLTDAVASVVSDVQVLAGRLVVKTDRGNTPYAELSDGERWRIAIDVGIAAVGENGLLTVKQSAWEALDYANRNAIAEHAKGRVVIITAEADHEVGGTTLRAEPFTADTTEDDNDRA